VPILLSRGMCNKQIAERLVITLSSSRRPVPATGRPLTSQETAAALTAYARRHPRAWATLRSNTVGDAV
jgi:hypothetical protein